MADTSIPKRFQVLEDISRDEAEVLVRARDEILKREIVISYPRPDPIDPASERDLDRLLRQAQALARVQHPGVVRLLDVLETEAGPMLVMEPVAGETLREVLARERRLPHGRVREMALKLCAALETVHAAGVIHRGIASSNVILRADGTPCLAGFVFAKFGQGGASVPGTTFDYAARHRGGPGAALQPAIPPHPAPEQILGQAADARADVFGLGWILYQCLTGENPYPLDQDPEHWDPPSNPRRFAPDIPKAFADAVLRCLHTSPLKRFGDVRELRVTLETLEKEGPSKSAASGSPARRRIALGSGAAGLLLVLGVVFVLRRGSREDPGRGDATLDETRGIPTKGIDTARSGNGAARYSEKYDRSHALLIGIGDVYAKNGFPALPNAERDVTALAERLRSIQSENETWDVSVLRGPEATQGNIRDRLSSISSEAGENDKIFVFYAGHGARHELSEKSGWIIPADGVLQEKDSSRKTWIRFDDFGHLFDESRSKHVLVAMDCCYGGRLVASRSASATTYSRRLVSEPAKIIISSGRPYEQVSDGARGENSPFARAFLDALSRTDVEAVTTTDIFGSILKKFLEEDVSHLPVRGNPPGSPQSGEVVFFLR